MLFSQTYANLAGGRGDDYFEEDLECNLCMLVCRGDIMSCLGGDDYKEEAKRDKCM